MHTYITVLTCLGYVRLEDAYLSTETYNVHCTTSIKRKEKDRGDRKKDLKAAANNCPVQP